MATDWSPCALLLDQIAVESSKPERRERKTKSQTQSRENVLPLRRRAGGGGGLRVWLRDGLNISG